MLLLRTIQCKAYGSSTYRQLGSLEVLPIHFNNRILCCFLIGKLHKPIHRQDLSSYTLLHTNLISDSDTMKLGLQYQEISGHIIFITPRLNVVEAIKFYLEIFIPYIEYSMLACREGQGAMRLRALSSMQLMFHR